MVELKVWKWETRKVATKAGQSVAVLVQRKVAQLAGNLACWWVAQWVVTKVPSSVDYLVDRSEWMWVE